MNARDLRDALQAKMTEDKSKGVSEERDVILMVPDGSGKPGNVKMFKLSEVLGSANEALPNLSDRIIMIEGEEL